MPEETPLPDIGSPGLYPDLSGLLHRCSQKKDMSEWNRWRLENPDATISLSEKDLSGLWLQGADLHKVDLRGANLRKALLQLSNLREADLRGSNLRNAKLIRADLGRSQLQEADLTDADLREADFLRSNLRDAVMQGANLEGAYMEGVELTGADLFGANLTNTGISREKKKAIEETRAQSGYDAGTGSEPEDGENAQSEPDSRAALRSIEKRTAALSELLAGIEKKMEELEDSSRQKYKLLRDDLDSSAEQIASYKKTIQADIATKAPVAYWNEVARKHGILSRLYGGLLAVLLVVSILGLFCYFEELHLKLEEKQYTFVGFGILISSMVVWLIRFVSRMFLSNTFLGTEAKERATVLQSYVALAKEDGVKLTEQQQTLFFQALLRQSSISMPQEDGVAIPVERVMEALEKQLKRPQ